MPDNPNHSPFLKLADILFPFDAADLLAAVGGLQLLPENADRSFRLEVLAHVVASLPGGSGKPATTLNRLRAICNSQPFGDGWIASQEDPFENPFTEAFVFHGGNFVVFPGAVDESTFVLRHMAEALFLSGAASPDASFMQSARELISGMLVLSNEVARRSGLGRGAEPISVPDRKVLVPYSSRLAELKRAVTFPQRDLEDLLAKHSVPLAALDALTEPLGRISLADYATENGKLLSRPIIRSGESYIIAIPGMLVSATRNELIHLAEQHGVKDEVAELFSDAIWDRVVESLGYLGNNLLRLPPPRTPWKPVVFTMAFSDSILIRLFTVCW